MAPTPIVLAIDVEPDHRVIARDGSAPLLGLEKLFTLVEGLRERIGELSGRTPRFTWMLRMDPQIAEAYGSTTFIVDRYEREFAELERGGDEIGLHTHFWRWNGGQWLSDHANAEWVEHCVDTALDAYRSAFGRATRTHSVGARFASSRLLRHLDDAGIEAE